MHRLFGKWLKPRQEGRYPKKVGPISARGGSGLGARSSRLLEEQTMQNHDPDKKKNSNEEGSLPAVSSNTLARCFGVSPKVIYDLAKAGIIARSAARLFPLEDSVRRYCEYLRSQARNST